MRYQFRRSNTLRDTEIPLEGEPIWDDQGRRLGFYNSAHNVINWFRIPRTGESENYIPEHRWVGSELQFKLPDGTWNPGEDLRGEGINNVAFVDNGDGTVKFIFYTANTSYELDVQLTPRHLGVFQADVEYVPLDEVSYEGSTYRVKYGDNPPEGTLPTNTTYFVLIARRGDTGGDPTWSAIQDKPTVFPPDDHTHEISEVNNLQIALDDKATLVHTHAISDTTGLQAVLDSKAPTVHAHAIEDVTGLQAVLDGKAPTVHTHVISDTTGLQTALDGKTDEGHVHVIANVTGLQAALDGKISAHDTALTGVPTAPTAESSTNTTQIATTAFVKAVVGDLIGAAPGLMDTLDEIAASLGDDPNFAATMTTQLSLKLDSSSYTAADVLAKLLTVDGASSGLDADLLDGQNGTYYLDRANHTGTQLAATISNFSTAADARIAAAIGVSVQAYSAVLAGTQESFTTTLKTKLDGIASGAQVNTNSITSVAGQTSGAVTLTKSDVGLSNVDNTSDAGKPVSTAQQTALDGKAANTITLTASTGLTGGGNLTANRSFAIDKATTAQIRAGTADKVVTADGIAAAMGWVAITAGSAPAISHTDGVNRTITHSANATMGAPSNAIPGFPLSIDITPGAFTTSWNAVYKFGSAGAPTITARRIFHFHCRDASTFVYMGMSEPT